MELKLLLFKRNSEGIFVFSLRLTFPYTSKNPFFITSRFIFLAGFLSFTSINFARMAIFMFVFSVILCISISMATNPPNYKSIVGLSFGTHSPEQKADNKKSYDTIDVVLSLILIILAVGVLSYFRG